MSSYDSLSPDCAEAFSVPSNMPFPEYLNPIATQLEAAYQGRRALTPEQEAAVLCIGAVLMDKIAEGRLPTKSQASAT